MASQTPNSSKRVRRNWLDLPPELMTRIFQKLEVVDILLRAQNVCTAWEKISLEPELWRSVHLPRVSHVSFCMDKIVREAVNRSRGQLEEFLVEDNSINFVTDELLRFVTQRCDLKHLRLVKCERLSSDGMINIIGRLCLLEELELCNCNVSAEVVEAFGNNFPQLKSFRLNYPRGRSGGDEYALAIAKSMLQLRHLDLFGNRLSGDSLKAILDGCPHLESLDLRQCRFLFLDKDLLKRCADAGIRKLRLRKDSPDDYEYNFESDDDDDEDSDLQYDTEDSDLLSDNEDSDLQSDTEDSDLQSDTEDSDLQSDTEDSDLNSNNEDSDLQSDNEDRDLQSDTMDNDNGDSDLQSANGESDLQSDPEDSDLQSDPKDSDLHSNNEDRDLQSDNEDSDLQSTQDNDLQSDNEDIDLQSDNEDSDFLSDIEDDSDEE